jgi:hypothetical protein
VSGGGVRKRHGDGRGRVLNFKAVGALRQGIRAMSLMRVIAGFVLERWQEAHRQAIGPRVAYVRAADGSPSGGEPMGVAPGRSRAALVGLKNQRRTLAQRTAHGPAAPGHPGYRSGR